MSRFDEDQSREYLVVFNADETPRETLIAVDPRAKAWQSLHGDCAPEPAAPGSYSMSLAALDFSICYSDLDG